MSKAVICSEYIQVKWVEAFAAIMGGNLLSESECKRYAKVLIAHAVANNILRETRLWERNFQDQAVHSFYVIYSGTKVLEKTTLLSTVFMETLIDIDPARMKLTEKGKEYTREVLLEKELKGRNLTFCLGNNLKKNWLQRYLYAITPISEHEPHIYLYASLGHGKYQELMKKDEAISEGALENDISDELSTGWKKLFRHSRFTLDQIKLLRECWLNPEKVNGLMDVKVGHSFFQMRMLQVSLTEEQKRLYWNCKIKDLTKFIEEASSATKH